MREYEYTCQPDRHSTHPVLSWPMLCSGVVRNAHMSFIENHESGDTVIDNGGSDVNPEPKAESRGVTFLYRLVVGQAHKSYGLNVARAAGMDEELINLAARKSAEMRDR